MSQILIKKNLVELTEAASALFLDVVQASILSRGQCSIALSGGSTPRSLYRFLSSEYKDSIDWAKIRFFFGDERNVPPADSDSNFRMVRETLLDPLQIDPRNVARWQTELGANEAADLYQLEVESNGPFDLVLLGLGADAHTASLFPNTAAIGETEKLAVANWVDKLGDFRLTMTFPAINGSRNVIFLVSGQEKAPALYNVLHREFRPEEYPAQLVQPVNGDLYWLCDEAAGRTLADV